MQQNNGDISNVQVPDSLIQEILEQTAPLKEGREEIYSSQEETHAPEQNQVVELLSLMLEEFDKLNSRLDELQGSIKEMTTTGMGMVGGPSPMEQPKKRKKQQS